MSAEAPENSEGGQFYPLEAYGEGMKLMEEMDVARANYFNACADFLEEKSERNRKLIIDSLGTYGRSFHAFVAGVERGDDREEFARTIGHLQLHQDNMRVDYLNGMLGKQLLEKSQFILDEDDIDEDDMSPEAVSLQLEAIAEDILMFFDSGLTQDTTRFINEIAPALAAKPKESFRTAAIKHGIDIGKIALGTALGIWMARSRRPI